MARIVINIAGGQTQPNILFTKEMHRLHGDIDQVIVLHTNFSEPQFKWTQKACNDLGAQFKPLLVPEDNIIAIQTTLAQHLAIEDEDELYVNITGGTKMMSIAVYDYFQKFSARIFYVTLGKNSYTQVLPRVKNREANFTYALSLEEYFTGYGVSIRNKKKLHTLIKPKEVTTNLYQKAINFNQIDWELLEYIRTGYREPKNSSIDTNNSPIDKTSKSLRGKSIVRGEGKSEEEISVREELFCFLDRIGFIFEEKDTLSNNETKYLTGDWFEEYVYHQLNDLLNIAAERWGFGIQIELENADHEKINNELDLAIMLSNTLHVIECKTRMITTNGFNILTDTLYKADSLRSKFGLRVPVFLFTLADETEVAKGIARSKLNDITIINRNQIQDSEFLKNLFRK